MRHCGRPPAQRSEPGRSPTTLAGSPQNPLRAGKRDTLSTGHCRGLGTGCCGRFPRAAAPARSADAPSRRRVGGPRFRLGSGESGRRVAGAAACTRPPPRLRRGSGRAGDGHLHAHVPSCRWRRPMGERGQRPDPGSQAHLGAGGGVRGEPREPVVPAGKEVLRHERRGEGPGPRRSTRSGRTGRQERDRRREPTPTGGRGSLPAESPVPQAQRRGWWCPRCSRSGTGGGGSVVSSSASQNPGRLRDTYPHATG